MDVIRKRTKYTQLA